MTKRNVEIIVLLLAILGSFLSIQVYVKRGAAGRFKLNNGEMLELSKLALSELEDFKKIEKQMNREQIQGLVGKPDRKMGNGLEIDVYLLPDGTEVWVAWTEKRKDLVYVIHNQIDLLTGQRVPPGRISDGP